MSIDPSTGLHRRGTSNTNARGSSEQRRRRREWLVETYRADVDVIRIYWPSTNTWTETQWSTNLAGLADAYERVRACRCYRCGLLLTVESVTVDRIIPGIKGGTYRRDNIRPACDRCNNETGQALRVERLKKKLRVVR